MISDVYTSTLVWGRGLYFFASATALARMARFFSSTLMGFTATAGSIGAPGPVPPMSTEMVARPRHRAD